MLDVDTFLTALYVMVDDFCQSHRPGQRRPGPEASLCESEVITLAIFTRWSRFASERDFYRFANTNLIEAFPTLPEEGVAVDWKKLLPAPKDSRAFLPKRWIVERSFAWVSHNRRMSKDYERLCATGEAFVYAAMARLMVRRLART